MTNPRPFAAARQLCPESDEYHAAVWFCTHCRMLEQRLTPIAMMPAIREAIADANLTIRNPFAEPAGTDQHTATSNRVCSNSTPSTASSVSPQ